MRECSAFRATGLDHIVVSTSDIDSTAEKWASTLGLRADDVMALLTAYGDLLNGAGDIDREKVRTSLTSIMELTAG